MLSRKKKNIVKEDLIRPQPPLPQQPNNFRRSAPILVAKTDVPNTNSALNGLIPRLGQVLANPSVERQREMKRLLYFLSDWENISDSTLVNLITELKANTEVLDEGPVLQQVLSSSWPSRTPALVASMENFLFELLVVRADFVSIALQSLISKFLTSNVAEQIHQISPGEEKIFAIAHRNLKKVIGMFEMKKQTAVKIMGAMYPFMGKDPHVHFCYVKNLIQTLDYMGDCSGDVLHLLVHKLVRIDVNIPSDPSSPLLQTMDSSIQLLFNHLKTHKLTQMEFNSLLIAFETQVLPTFSLQFVQFLYFYLVSLDSAYLTTYLDFLWRKATNVNTPSVIRIQSMAYCSGLLSRGKFVPIVTAKRWLTRMAEWASTYVVDRVGNAHWSSLNLEAHGPFYAICQSIFYLFAFRNKELLGERKSTAFTRTLSLGQLITSDLNPLKACAPQVCESFASAALTHEICYLGSILERNSAARVPNATIENNFKIDCIEGFFPFDECRLECTSSYITPIHRAYDPYVQVKIEKEDEDSIEMELGSLPKTNGFKKEMYID